MMKFDGKYFKEFSFTLQQIEANMANAFRDLDIAKKVDISEVKFNYTYTAFIKAGITLLSHFQVKIKSVPGHHAKIIEQMAVLLKDDSVIALGHVMRSKRNKDFYGGGIDVTNKESREYLQFTENVLNRIKAIIQNNGKELK